MPRPPRPQSALPRDWPPAPVPHSALERASEFEVLRAACEVRVPFLERLAGRGLPQWEGSEAACPCSQPRVGSRPFLPRAGEAGRKFPRSSERPGRRSFEGSCVGATLARCASRFLCRARRDRARGGRALAARRARRRHDAAGQAALEARSRRGRRLAARLPHGSALVSATNGKTTTAAMAAEILRAKVRLAHNASGANLVSGVASTLLAAARCRSSGCSRSTRPRCPRSARRVRPRAVALGNLFRDQLDRYGELELVAERWREARRRARRRHGSSSTPTTRCSATSRASAPDARSSSASTTRVAPRQRSSTRPTRSTASAAARRTTTPPRTSGTSATTAARTAAMRGRRSTWRAREIELRRPRRRRVHARRRRTGARRVRAAAARALQRLQRARRGGARAGPRRVARRGRRAGSSASAPRSAASSGSRSATGVC